MDDLAFQRKIPKEEYEIFEAKIPATQFFVALLHGEKSPFKDCMEGLQEVFSPLDFQSTDHPFESSYYEAEIGTNLSRRIISFSTLLPADQLAEAKHQCRILEEEFAIQGNRSVNLDVGYLDQHRVVLASFKEMRNKIYLGKGVWADWSLQYEKGHFNPLPWCFADFKSGVYEKDFLRIRELYKKKLKEKQKKKASL